VVSESNASIHVRVNVSVGENVIVSEQLALRLETTNTTTGNQSTVATNNVT